MSRDGNVEVMAPHSHPLDPEGVSAAWVGVALRHLRAAGLVQRERRLIYYGLAGSRLHDVMARGQTIAAG